LIAMRYRVLHSRTREYRWYSAQAVALDDSDGNVQQWIGAAVDIDDEVRSQQALVNSFETEITGVRNFQRALIPTVLPAMSGLSLDGEYRVGSRAGLIGGDWYDSTLLRDGRLLFSIGDVMGHGMEAAIDMSRVRQSIITVAATTAQPTEILRRVNDVVNMQDIIATAIVGVVDPASRHMELACAGHPRPIVRPAGGALHEVDMNGMPLGVVEVLRCETATIDFAPGDEFIFYTDGLVEFSRDIQAASNELFAAIRDVDGPLAGRARRLCDAVLGTAAQPDDVAVLVLRISEAVLYGDAPLPEV
jgi:serine phosphatase RsbU (regulator of sigma subunit)